MPRLNNLAAVVRLGEQNPDIVPSGVAGVLVQCEAQDVRFTFNGDTNPTNATGFLLKAGDPPIRLDGTGVVKSLRLIEAAGGAVVNIGWLYS